MLAPEATTAQTIAPAEEPANGVVSWKCITKLTLWPQDASYQKFTNRSVFKIIDYITCSTSIVYQQENTESIVPTSYTVHKHNQLGALLAPSKADFNITLNKT